MALLSTLLLAGVEVARAEGRAVRRATMRLAVALALLAVCAALLFIGLALAVWGFFILLANAMGPAGAAFLTAAISVLVALLVLVLAKTTAAR